MMPTLEDGDRMIVNKIGYKIGEPKRFDIVVFHAPEQKLHKACNWIAGDTLEYKDDQLYINGEPIEEPYLDAYKAQITEGTLTEDFTLNDIDVSLDSNTIPEGYIFVMGDNRRYSKDSRHIGLVNQKEIIGNTSLIFWPFSDIKL